MGVFNGAGRDPRARTLRRPEGPCDHPPVTRRKLAGVAGLALLVSTLLAVLAACSAQRPEAPEIQPARLAGLHVQDGGRRQGRAGLASRDR